MTTRTQLRRARVRSHRARLALVLAAVLGLTTLAAVPGMAAATATVGMFAEDLTPTAGASGRGSAIELGVRFSPRSDGEVTALQYYQGRAAQGVTQATLWSSQGTVLSRVRFSATMTAGWRTIDLAQPVKLHAGETYTVSYHAPEGRYPVIPRDLRTKRVLNGFVLERGAGVYRHGDSRFPNRSARGSNFLVDIAFEPDAPGVLPSPTATATPSPTATATPAPTPTRTPAPSPTVTPTPDPSPTVTPTPTPTPVPPATPAPPTTTPPALGGTQKNCIEVPSVCGYPDATNTGVADDSALIRVPQDATSGPGWSYRPDIRAIQTTGNGVTIQNLSIADGMIIVAHSGVTLRNIFLDSGAYYPIDCDYVGVTRDAHSCLGLTAENVEIAGTANCQAALSFRGYTARRVYVHGCLDGFKANSDVRIEDSYVTALAVVDGSHNDGLQSTAEGNIVVRHSTFKLGNQSGVNAVFQMGQKDRGGRGVTIQDSLIDGGGWMLNSTPIAGIVVEDNRFTRRSAYGIGYVSGGRWTGNVWDDTLGPIPEND